MGKRTNRGLLITIVILSISPLIRRVLTIPIWITIVMLLGGWLVSKNNKKYFWYFLGLLVYINLYLNRLLSIDLFPLEISFDVEQSFFKYPGIENSILRYKEEGLWLVYPLRNLFYNNYLLIFSWLTNFMKLLSLTFWIKLIGFSGFPLFLFGLDTYIKDKNRNNYIIIWFLLVMATSALRVLGDTVTFGYLTIPVVFYLIFQGTKNKIFYNYFYLWLLLFIVDLTLI